MREIVEKFDDLEAGDMAHAPAPPARSIGRTSRRGCEMYDRPMSVVLEAGMAIPHAEGAHRYVVRNYSKVQLCVSSFGAEQQVFIKGSLPDAIDHPGIATTQGAPAPGDVYMNVMSVKDGGGLIPRSFFTIYCPNGITPSIIDLLDQFEALRCFK